MKLKILTQSILISKVEVINERYLKMNSVQPWMYSEIKCNFCNRLHKKEDDKNFMESLKGTVAQEKFSNCGCGQIDYCTRRYPGSGENDFFILLRIILQGREKTLKTKN